ncbi:hypothetical protein SUDANB121_00771 [Nocardiopsis dassonvillei]|uniref:hypothetical protein n=1 Tax=Nocardiopsis dassonvillei TaxID=2014 RepID=UPI003F579CD8
MWTRPVWSSGAPEHARRRSAVPPASGRARASRSPWPRNRLVDYVVKKSPHAEELRPARFADPDPVVAAAGWALTTERVAKRPEGLDPAGPLGTVEARVKNAPDRLRWAVDECPARIGIEHAEYRERAVGIGERLEVLRDHPTPRAARPRSRPSGPPGRCGGRRARNRVGRAGGGPVPCPAAGRVAGLVTGTGAGRAALRPPAHRNGQ